MIEKRDMVIKTDVRWFVPFSEGNILEKIKCDFHIDDKTLRMRATSGFYPLFATITECIYDKDSYENGFTMYKVATGDGYNSLFNKEIDILFSTEPSENQRKAMEASGGEYIFVPLLMEPLAIIVNKANPIDDISTDEIKKLYFEEIKNWKDICGKDMPVMTYQLTDGNGSQTCFTKLVKDNPLNDLHKEVPTMPGIIDDIAYTEGAICYAFWSYYTKMYSHARTKMIKVNGRETMDPDYPLQHTIYMIYRADNPNKEIERLRDFLTSEEGKALIERANQVHRDYGADL